MKKIIYFLFIAVFCNSISAQNDTLKLTLNQALQLGLANRFDIKGNHLNIDIARNRLIKSNKELLPDLSANGKLVYYGELQPSIIPAGYLGFTEPKKIAIGMKNTKYLIIASLNSTNAFLVNVCYNRVRYPVKEALPAAWQCRPAYEAVQGKKKRLSEALNCSIFEAYALPKLADYGQV